MTLEELCALVWRHPIVHIARELGISNTALSNCCKRNGIPTPKAGHWTRVELGLPVEAPPSSFGCQELSKLISLPVKSSIGDLATQTKRDRSEVSKTTPSPIISENLTDLHPIVNRWLDSKSETSSGRWRDLDCRDNLAGLSEYDDFRLRVTSAFLRSVEAGGVEVIKAHVNGRFELRLGDARLIAIIRQKMSEFEREGIDHENWTAWPEHHGYWLYPTKDIKFVLKGDCVKTIEFQCSKKQVVSKGLKRFVVCVLAAERAMKRLKKSKRELEIQRNTEVEREKQKARSDAMDRKIWEHFEEEACQWENSQKLLSFIASLRRYSAKHGAPDIEGMPFEQWLEWAQSRALAMSPMSRLEELFKPTE